MLVLSANQPKNAEPKPPKPNIRPKNMPAIRPTLSGIKSVAYTTIDEKAEAMINPEKNVQTIVQQRLEYGIIKANGAAPRIENHITYFLPNLSPNIPPTTVPMAKAARNTNKQSCEACTLKPNLSIKKNVK